MSKTVSNLNPSDIVHLVNGRPFDPNQPVNVKRIDRFEQKIYYAQHNHVETPQQSLLNGLATGLGLASAGGIIWAISTVARKIFAGWQAGSKAAVVASPGGILCSTVAGVGAGTIAAIIA